MGLKEIYARERHFQFPIANFKGFLFAIRPGKLLLFQFFLPGLLGRAGCEAADQPKTKSVPVPVDDLQVFPVPVAEHKQAFGKRRKLHLVLDQYGQAVDRFPQIGNAGLKVELIFAGIDDHHSPLSARSVVACVSNFFTVPVKSVRMYSFFAEGLFYRKIACFKFMQQFRPIRYFAFSHLCPPEVFCRKYIRLFQPARWGNLPFSI